MTTAVRTVDVHEARRLADQGAVLLDVREDDEWAQAHIDGATHVPLGTLDPAAVGRDRLVVAVCRSGNRSGRAAEALAGAGVDVVNMTGGVLAWAEAGLPLVVAGE
ncbi:rhodanese-like domain-containing protein [Nocardioides sp. GY 10127]|uniref:rhodanese-like domain-containing protein n=1 Tax=Nocardioides sp. GY 10127 TaxID=2569762 RepID=UPI0010A755E0|nr:rhodanese-like domain-containing protein [Nocardioides sp. GY 10127]TIC78689.1 rhodanese-like domain-containing protein [Nocardioides sp. GY 10127]TIC81037.1 rhodanese-like domain-containing protein [Nocardioides sp. GY 10127]